MAKRFKKRKIRGAVIAVLCSALLLLFGIGGVWAYLVSQTDTLSNSFVPAHVTCAVEEDFTDGVKSNVTVRNTGDINAYLRAAVVATFVAEDGKVLSAAPVEGTDYTVVWGESGWQKGSDGFWYYTVPVAPGVATANLIQTASSVAAPDGYRLNLQIIATAIQAEPENAVQEAWGVTVVDGALIPN